MPLLGIATNLILTTGLVFPSLLSASLPSLCLSLVNLLPMVPSRLSLYSLIAMVAYSIIAMAVNGLLQLRYLASPPTRLALRAQLCKDYAVFV